MGVCRQSEPDSSWMHTVIGGGNELKLENGKFQLAEKKSSLPTHVGGQTLEEVAQTYCGISILAVTQNFWAKSRATCYS